MFLWSDFKKQVDESIQHQQSKYVLPSFEKNWNHRRLLTLHSVAKIIQSCCQSAFSAASSGNSSLWLKDPAASLILKLGLETGALLYLETDGWLLRWFRGPVPYPHCRCLLRGMQLPRPEAASWNIQGAPQRWLLKEFRFILTVILPRSMKHSKGRY